MTSSMTSLLTLFLNVKSPPPHDFQTRIMGWGSHNVIKDNAKFTLTLNLRQAANGSTFAAISNYFDRANIY